MTPQATPSARRSLALLALLGSFGFVGACAGPETATRVRTDDVADPSNDALRDRAPGDSGGGTGSSGSGRAPDFDGGAVPQPDVVGVQTPPGGAQAGSAAGWEAAVDEFAMRVAAATKGKRGSIALFPPFGMSSASNDFRGCEFGDIVAERIAMRLASSGCKVLQGTELQKRITDTNRGLDLMVDVGSAQALAERVAQVGLVDAIVTGVAELGRRQDLGGPRIAKLRLEATAPFSGGSLATTRLSLSAAESVAVGAGIETQGAWKIGNLAPRFVPSTERELSVVAAAMLAELVDRAPEKFDGKRVLVQPLVTNDPKGGARRVGQFSRTFMRALRVTEEKLAADGVADTFAVAMRSDLAKPFEFEGKTYKTAMDAMARYDELRAEVEASGAGRIAQNFATDLGGIVRALSGDRAKLVNVQGREGAVTQILADSIAYADDGSVDPSSIAMQQAGAAEFMITAALDQGLDQSYVMRISILDLTDANDSENSRVALEPWMTERLDAILQR